MPVEVLPTHCQTDVGQGRSDDHKEVAADLFRFQCLRKLPGEKKKIDIEVNAKQDHKDSDDDLNI
jgi:hypothetical protein